MRSEGDRVMDAATRDRWLDQAIVACLLLIPHSYLLWLNSSEFGASPMRRLPLFLLPALLVGAKLAHPRPRRPSGFDQVVVWLWLLVLGQGIVMALLHTEHFSNTVTAYAQVLFWLALVGIYLATTMDDPTRVFEMMRRYFVFVAVCAWLFSLLYLALGPFLPHSPIEYPQSEGGSLVVAQNYYFTLVYSFHTVFGQLVPRFAFLYTEPRVLGMQLVMGIILQIGYVRARWSSWRRGRRLRGVVELALLLGTVFWTHSLNGYIVSALFFLILGVRALMGDGFWRHMRALHLAIIGLAIATLTVIFILVGQDRDLSALAQEVVTQDYMQGPGGGTALFDVIGKPPDIVVSYATAYVTGPRRLLLFPLGTGMMNLDAGRFMARYGISTTAGATLPQTVVLHAGAVGLIALCVILWRLLGRFRKVAMLDSSPEVRYACLLGAFLLVISTIYVDLASMSAFAPLVFGSLMNLRPQA